MVVNIKLRTSLVFIHLLYWRMALTCSNLPWMSSFTLGEFARTRTYSPDHANRSWSLIIPIGHDHDHAIIGPPLQTFCCYSFHWSSPFEEHRDEILTHPIECVGHVVKSVDMGVPKHRCWIWTIWGSTGWKKFTKFISITRIFTHLFMLPRERKLWSILF